MPKKENETKQSKIVDVDCIVFLSDKAFYVKWEDVTYISSRALVKSLLDGTLNKKGTKTKAKAIQLGILDDNGINNDTGVFITVKGKSVYFTPDPEQENPEDNPEEKRLFVTAISTLVKLFDEDNESVLNVKMGLFQKE